MKIRFCAATFAAAVALGAGSMAAAQDSAEPSTSEEQSAPAPERPMLQMPAPAPDEEEAEGEDKPTLFEILAKRATTRLDPEQRAQALLDDIPVTVSVAPMELANMFTRLEQIHRSVAIDVPLRLTDLDGTARKGTVWHKGPVPSDLYLGETGAHAASAATVNVTWKDGTTGTIELYEARFLSTSDPASLTSLDGRAYCATHVTTPDGERDMCLIDRNNDDTFDEIAFIADRTGKSVHSATILTAAVPMAKALPYTVRRDNLPLMKVQWSTCGKDWDLPYYRMHLSVDERGDKVSYRGSAKGYGQPYCAKATVHEAILPDEKGATIARLGPVYAQISAKKKGAEIEMRGMLDLETLYRLERRDKLAALSVGFAPAQATLAAAQQFDRLPYQSTGVVTANTQVFKAGEPFITSAFRHGYTGIVTQDVEIRTLFSKRAVANGTPVYGVPAKRTVTVYGGYGYAMPQAPAVERVINMDVIWCLPTREEVPVLDKLKQPTGEVTIEWTATCLPDNRRGQHTILQDQAPALAVRNMKMNAEISTNEGPPPVEERPSADFGAPVSFRYVLKGPSKSFYEITEEVLLGDEVTSSTEMVVFKDKDGKALIEVAGGSFMLEPVGEDFQLTPMLPVREGEDARVKGVDVLQLLRSLMSRMEN